MNHVYRVIWSKVKHCYVVVSEIAKRNGKSSSKVSRAGITALALVGTISLGTSVYADNPTGNSTLTADQQAVYKAVLHELENNGVHYVSVKGTSKDANTNFNNDGAKKTGGIAIGEKAKSEGSSDIAIGRGANSAGGWGIALGANTNVSGQTGIAIGNEANSAGNWGMAIGVDAKNTSQLGMAIGYATQVTDVQGLALGVQAKVTKAGGIGIGTNANVSGVEGISFGNQTKAAGVNAISIGRRASSSAKHGIAVGTNSNVAATASQSIAIGLDAYVGPVTDEHTGTAMPKPGDAWKPEMPFQPTDDDTIPEEHKKAPEANSLAIGMSASAFGYQNVAIGAAAEAHDTNSTAVGVAAVAKGHYSTALGKQARTYGQETTSVGHWADTRDEFATALGANSIAYKKGATALGSNARAYDENSVAIGANSIAKEAVDGKAVYTNEDVKAAAGIVSVGHPDYKVGDKEVKANYRRIVNVAGGILDHDAVNVAQLKAAAVHYISVKGSSKDADTNFNNDGAKKDGGIAIGDKAKSENWDAIAIGSGSNSAGGWGMAIGVEAQNTEQLGMAIGHKTKVTAAHGLALGVQASTSGEDAISIGTIASSSAMRGIAVGTFSNVAATAARGIAIGDGAYVGPVTDKHTGTAMPKPKDEWKPEMPFQPRNDDTKPEENNKTPQENSLAIGMRASAFGFQNVAIGAAAQAHDTNSTAVGVAAVAKGHHSTALGKQARTYGQETTSVGHWADTQDEFATALGANSTAYKKGATALGSNARAYDENSVAIGANSIAKEAVDGKAVYTDEEVKAAAGIVSVGHPDYKVGDKEVKANYRRIVNVAGGILDHDAVNVAQLKAIAGMTLNVYSGGTVANNIYTPGTKINMPLNKFKLVFGDGLKAEQVTDADKNTYTFVTLDKDSLHGDPNFKGDKGDKGTDGKSAYEVWKEQPGNDGKSEDDFMKSLKGDKGTDGVAGKDGANGKSAYELWKEQQGNDGKSEDDFMKSLKGDKGTDGVAGKDGANGKSAYELWKEQPGNDGKSEDDFMKSLKGDKGTDGVAGKDGANGKSAYELWKEQPGNDGKSEDDFMKSLKGDKGADGAKGTDGKSAYDIWKAQPGNDGRSEQEFLKELKGKAGKDGKGTGVSVDIQGDPTGIQVTSKTNNDKTTYTVKLDKKINAGKISIDGSDTNGTITGLSNTTWDVKLVQQDRAATEGQLQQVSQSMQNSLANMGQRMNRAGASNAALAALHPLDFDAQDKWNFAAGFGNYMGANALALGAFYRPNETTQFSIGGSFGNGENMINAGVSLKVGKGSLPISSKVEMARQLTAQAQEIERLQQKDKERDMEMAAMKEREAQLWKELQNLKHNH